MCLPSSLGNHKQAIEDYNKAIETDPKFMPAYHNRGDAYKNLGNYKQAIEDYDKVIELNPKNASAYASRGDAYSKLGNNKLAIKDYKTGARMGHQGCQRVLRAKGVRW